MPQTIEDGERFGTGDTAYKNCFDFIRARKTPKHGGGLPEDEDNLEAKDRLNPNGAL